MDLFLIALVIALYLICGIVFSFAIFIAEILSSSWGGSSANTGIGGYIGVALFWPPFLIFFILLFWARPK